MLELTRRQACRFLLLHHGLMPTRAFPAAQAGVLEFMDRIRCIQFDPLCPVAYNHDLVLHSRVKGYRPAHLYSLAYDQRRVLDVWDKNQSLILSEDWPYFARIRQKALDSRYYNVPEEDILSRVLDAVEKSGPLSSADLDEFSEKTAWAWGPAPIARAALQTLYERGDLVIHHKEGTRRIYDLAERHLSVELRSAPDPNPDEDAYDDWYVLRRTSGVGMLSDGPSDAFLGRTFSAARRKAAFERLIRQGTLLPVRILDDSGPMLYIRAQDAPLLEEVDKSPGNRFRFLAPLDSLLWDRKLIERLFGFTYRWEVYKPEAQREYGYYVQPVLYRDQLVGRFEPTLDRKRGILTIKNWWWEQDACPTPQWEKPLHTALKDFSDFAGANAIELSEEARPKLAFLSV